MVHVQVTKVNALNAIVLLLAVTKLGLVMVTAIQSIIMNFVDMMLVTAVQVIV